MKDGLSVVKHYCEHYEKLGYKFIMCQSCGKIVREIKPLGSMNKGLAWVREISCECRDKNDNMV